MSSTNITLGATENALALRPATLPPLHVAAAAHPGAIAGPVTPGAATAGIDQTDILTPYLGRFVDGRA